MHGVDRPFFVFRDPPRLAPLRQPCRLGGFPARLVQPQHGVGEGDEPGTLPHIAGDGAEAFGAGAMPPGIAIAARCAAALAAMHPAAAMTVDRRRAAGRTRTGARAAAWGAGENVRLHGLVDSIFGAKTQEQRGNIYRAIGIAA